MKPIRDTLAGSASASAVAELSKAFGTDPTATQAALAHVADEISRRMERLTLSRGGLADLVRAIGDSHHEGYLKDPRLIRSSAMERDGKAILDHVFWSKDASRGVAARAARTSGLPAETIEDMLPSIAALSMGELTRAAAGPFDDILRRIPGLDEALQEMRRQADSREQTEPEPDMEPQAPPPSHQRPPGRQTDAGIPEQRPLPLPGNDLPSPDRGGSRYDDLSDILRRGGFRIPGGGGGGGGSGGGQGGGRIELPDSLPGDLGGAAGGTLYNIIRAVLGALLGFQSRGLISWIIRLLVVRWGWGFIQRILGRILGRAVLGR